MVKGENLVVHVSFSFCFLTDATSLASLAGSYLHGGHWMFLRHLSFSPVQYRTDCGFPFEWRLLLALHILLEIASLARVGIPTFGFFLV